MVFDPSLLHLARLTLDDAQSRSLRIATAESCTGGLIAALLTEIPGSSAVFERGFVTYSNRAKSELLGVPGDMIADCGAVSEPVARAMAEGALSNAHAHVAVAVTGVAGPGGGTPHKPVGLVHLAAARANASILHQRLDLGPLDRSQIRILTVEAALMLLRRVMS